MGNKIEFDEFSGQKKTEKNDSLAVRRHDGRGGARGERNRVMHNRPRVCGSQRRTMHGKHLHCQPMHRTKDARQHDVHAAVSGLWI
jgi:hypothetical protein